MHSGSGASISYTRAACPLLWATVRVYFNLIFVVGVRPPPPPIFQKLFARRDTFLLWYFFLCWSVQPPSRVSFYSFFRQLVYRRSGRSSFGDLVYWDQQVFLSPFHYLCVTAPPLFSDVPFHPLCGAQFSRLVPSSGSVFPPKV